MPSHSHRSVAKNGNVSMKCWQLTMMILLCVVLLCASVQARSRHSHTMTGNRSGILYGQNYAFVLTAPKGWVLDTHSGRAEGAAAVFYPEGSSWEASSAVMYAQVVPITDPARQTLRFIIQSVINQMRAQSPRLVVRVGLPLPTASSQRAAVRKISGTPDGNQNAVAFLSGRQSDTELVLSAHTDAQFRASWTAFKRLVASYSAFPHATVTPPSVMPVQTLHCQQGAWKVVFSPHGRLIAVGETGCNSSVPVRVEVWNRRTNHLLFALPYSTGITAVCFSPHGHVLAAGSDLSNIVLWNTVTGRRIAALPNTEECYALAFSPDGTMVGTATGSKAISMWSVSTHRLLRRLPWPGSTEWNIWSLDFSPDGKTIAAGAGESGYVRTWDVATGKIMHTILADRQDIDSVAYSPQGHLLATGSLSGMTKLWNTRNWHLLRRIPPPNPGESVFPVSFSPNGRLLAIGYSEHDAMAVLVSVATGKCVCAFHQSNPNEDVFGMAFSPQGRFLATAEMSVDADAETFTSKGRVFLWPVPHFGVAASGHW